MGLLQLIVCSVLTAVLSALVWHYELGPFRSFCLDFIGELPRIGHLLTTSKHEASAVDPDLAIELGAEGLLLFHQHDRNEDGVLSIEEFVPIARRIVSQPVDAAPSQFLVSLNDIVNDTVILKMSMALFVCNN